MSEDVSAATMIILFGLECARFTVHSQESVTRADTFETAAPLYWASEIELRSFRGWKSIGDGNSMSSVGDFIFSSSEF